MPAQGAGAGMPHVPRTDLSVGLEFAFGVCAGYMTEVGRFCITGARDVHAHAGGKQQQQVALINLDSPLHSIFVGRQNTLLLLLSPIDHTRHPQNTHTHHSYIHTSRASINTHFQSIDKPPVTPSRQSFLKFTTNLQQPHASGRPFVYLTAASTHSCL